MLSRAIFIEVRGFGTIGTLSACSLGSYFLQPRSLWLGLPRKVSSRTLNEVNKTVENRAMEILSTAQRSALLSRAVHTQYTQFAKHSTRLLAECESLSIG